MTPAIHIFGLILGYLALLFLLLRFGKTRSYKEIALFFLLAPIWLLVLSACDLSIAIRAFAETSVCRLLRLALAGFAGVMAFYLIHTVQPRRYTKMALRFAIVAASIVFALGAVISITGSVDVFGAMFFPFFGLSPGFAAVGFASFLLIRSFRSGNRSVELLFLLVLAVLGLAGLGVFFLPGSQEENEWIRNGLYLIFGAASVAMIGFSLPFAFQPAFSTGKGGEENDEGGGDADPSMPKAESAESAYLLSNREMEIAKLLLTGKSYREIGEMLFIAPSTVKTHVLRIYEKAGVNNKMELANRLAKPE